MNGILADEVQPGEAVVIRYEGSRRAARMQEMLYPTSYLKSKKLDKACALITDGQLLRRHLGALGSATSRRRPPRAGRSPSSARAMRSRSTSPAA